MAYAVISDIHANLSALDTVLSDINGNGIVEIYFAGDVVGYGPRPNECIDLVKEHCMIMLAGNHDYAAIGLTDISNFNEHARNAVIWTSNALTDEHLDDLANFHIIKSSSERDALFVHSTPIEPEMWSYIFSIEQVMENFKAFTQTKCFIGHSHLPMIFELSDNENISIFKQSVRIKEGYRYIINVGSVGQPRDNNPKASYAIVNDEQISIVRVPYDIRKTQSDMIKAQLPDILINRLTHGT